MTRHILIMSGGRSERMRAGGCPTHKALRRVGDQSLIERNLIKACRAGFRDVWVAVSSREADLQDWLFGRGRRITDPLNVQLNVLIEHSPLGTIGAARLLPGKIDNLVVLNVDNLSSIDFNELLEKHLASNAVMTIAVHQESFQIPFGRIESTGGFLDNYLEKPVLPVTISSGVYVLTQRAIQMIPTGVQIHVPDLVNRLSSVGERIFCYQHSASWLDINDEQALARANAVLSSLTTSVQA